MDDIIIVDGSAVGIRNKVNALAKVQSARSTPQKVAFLGDSLTDFATTIGANSVIWTTVSYVSWLKWMLGDRIYTDASLVLGVASQQSSHVLNTQVPQAIAAGCNFAWIMIGINDVGAGTAASTTVNNIRQSVVALNDAGIGVGLIGPYPGSTFNDAKSAAIYEINRQCYLMSQDPTLNVRYVNVLNTLLDFSTSNNYVLSSYMTVTGTHLNSLGSYVLAQAVYAIMDRLLVPQVPMMLAHGVKDTFNATDHPTGVLNLTGDFRSGTGGNIVQQSANNAASGTVPLGWSGGFTGTASTTATVAFSQVNDSDYPLKNLLVTLGGTADAAVPKVDTTVSAPVTGLNAGDRVQAFARVKWANLAGVKEVNLTLSVFSGGTTLDYQCGQAPVTSPDGTTDVPGALPATMPWLYLSTDAVTLPSGWTSLRLRVLFTLISGATVSGTVNLSQCFIRRVI